MAYFEITKKESTFHLWDEYLYLLELLQTKYPENTLICELLQLQIEKKCWAEVFQERKEKPRLHHEINNLENIDLEKEVILKWEEFIIEAFYFLQEARIWGGTYGHKVGPIWYSQKSIKEKYEWEILKLRFLNKLIKN
jgi:hypothetical protein